MGEGSALVPLKNTSTVMLGSYVQSTENGQFGANGMSVIEPVVLVDNIDIENASTPNHRMAESSVTALTANGKSAMRESHVQLTVDGQFGVNGMRVTGPVVLVDNIDIEGASTPNHRTGVNSVTALIVNGRSAMREDAQSTVDGRFGVSGVVVKVNAVWDLNIDHEHVPHRHLNMAARTAVVKDNNQDHVKQECHVLLLLTAYGRLGAFGLNVLRRAAKELGNDVGSVIILPRLTVEGTASALLKKTKLATRMQCASLMEVGQAGEYGDIVLQLVAKAFSSVYDFATTHRRRTAG